MAAAGPFFGMQVVVRSPRGSSLRQRIRGLLVDPSPELSVDEKSALLRNLASTLGDSAALFERGYWDFVPDPGSARAEMDDWCDEIEAEAGDPADPALGAGESPYFIVTLACTLRDGSPAADALGVACDLPEEAYWTRESFASLLAAVGEIDVAGLTSDAVYLNAGAIDPETGREEIDGEGYEYLRRIE